MSAGRGWRSGLDPGLLGALTRRLPFLALLALLYVGAAHGLSFVLAWQAGQPVCEVNVALVECAIPAQSVFQPAAYLCALGLCVVALAGVQLLLRDHAASPFLGFVLVGLLACIVFDTFARRPVQNLAPLYSGMFNALNFVISLSFVCVLVLVRARAALVPPFARAVTVSYAQSVLGFAVYAWLQQGFLGATTSFLGFLIYAFGVFSIHLMCVLSLVVQGAPPRAESGASPLQAAGLG